MILSMIAAPSCRSSLVITAIALFGCLSGSRCASAARHDRSYSDASDFSRARWLLAVNESSVLEDATAICKPYPSTSPKYGILAHLEGLLTRKSDAGHKPLFPLAGGDIAGFVLTWFVLFIAAGGGIGGGGAIIPLYILFLGFSTRIAVALGNITIVGGALSNFVFNVPRRHAFLSRPLIDWDLILVMEPATILGALAGGYLNKLFPNWLTTVLLAILLTFISYKLISRGVVCWQKETIEHASERSDEELQRPLLDGQQNRPSGPLTINTGHNQPVNPSKTHDAVPAESHSPLAYTASLTSRSISFSFRRGADEADVANLNRRPNEDRRPGGGSDTAEEDEEQGEDESHEEPQRLSTLEEQALEHGEPGTQADNQNGQRGQAERPVLSDGGEHALEGREEKQHKIDELFAEKRQVPPLRFGILVLLTAVVAASDILKGLVRCGSWAYWLIVAVIIPVVLLVTFGARNYLLKKRRRKQAAGYVWQEGDVDWNSVTTLTYPAICSLAGLVAGMFGVGGGIVKIRSFPSSHAESQSNQESTRLPCTKHLINVIPGFSLETNINLLQHGPLMLELGVLPDVASATSATMIVFTSASASIVFLSFGGIPVDYAIAVFVVGIVFTMLGQIACYMLMRLLQRRSVIVFAMAALMVLSMVIVYYEAIAGTISAVHEHHLWRFGRLCV